MLLLPAVFSCEREPVLAEPPAEPGPLPDLVPARIQGPAVAWVGRSIAIEYRIDNAGELAAPGTAAHRVVLSTDSVVHDGDVVLGDVPAESLGAGAYTAGSAEFDVPTGTAEGEYLLILAADFTQLVDEEDEENNTATGAIIPVRLQRDLAVEYFRVSTREVPNDPEYFVIDYEHRAESVGAAAYSGSYYYAVAISKEDQHEWSGEVGGDGPHSVGDDALHSDVLARADYPPGPYYAFLLVDARYAIPEPDEDNNVVRVPFEVPPL